MKERPIIFSVPMVKAILNTKPGVWPAEPIDPEKPYKSMTRRVINPQPILKGHFWELGGAGWSDNIKSFHPVPCHSLFNRMPHKPSDVLWVRETWLSVPWVYDKEDSDENSHAYFYRADGEIAQQHNLDPEADQWRPSIFMPREAARIYLELKSIRVEQLQSISVEDCIAEGMPCDNKINNPDQATHESIKNWNLTYAQFLYKELWDSLNAKRGYSWESKPWVWVYEFMRVER
jgi:hypothetical protein